MKKQTKATFKKIEIDENTAEPVIVDINQKDYEKLVKLPDKSVTTLDGVKLDEVTIDNAGKQTVINKIVGLGEDNSVSKRQRMLKRITSVVFILLVVGVLGYTFYNDFFASGETISWSNILTVLSSTWFYILFALVALGFLFFFKGFKLSFLCKCLTGKFRFKICMQTAVIGHYYNNITPLAAGGQPFEIYHLSKNGINGGVGAALPISTFFMNQLAFVVLSIISLALLPKSQAISDVSGFLPATISVMAIIGILCCFFVPSLTIIFSIFPRLGALLIKFVIWLGSKLRVIKNPAKTKFSVLRTVINNSRCLTITLKRPYILITSFLLSVCENLANCSIAYFTLRFFGLNLHVQNGFIEWMLVVQLCFILYSAISFIPTPGNSGAADLSFYLLFKQGLNRGVNAAGTAFPALLTWRVLSYYSLILVGFIFVKANKRKEKKAAMAAKAASESEGGIAE